MNRQEKLNMIDEVVLKGPYQDNWDSLSDFEAPKWLRNAKFGIFIHWGVYSVPAFSNEWYSRNMYIKGSPEFEHHIKTYGLHKDFGYKDFIPMFTADKFNPDEWAELFRKAGARYVVPVAEHHDGFQMYKSELSRWNAYEMGPKRDVIGELLSACAERNIVCGASSHRIEHWFFMGHGKEFESDIKEPLTCGDFYWAAMPEPQHHDLFSEPAPSGEYLEDWLLRTCEIIDRYMPQLVYFDWWIQHSAVKPYLKKFTAYYYNRALEWNKEVAIVYKHDAFMFGAAVVDIERGKFADVQPFFWQMDTAVAKNSWCYTADNQYKLAKTLICDLADTVSKNGTMLLNIGPKPDGSIPEQDKAILEEIGSWLRVNGEAIYDTSVWRKALEGPTKTPEGQFTDTDEQEFTSEDIRFTIKGSYLYAIVLKCPENGNVCVRSLAEQDASRYPVFHGIIKDVILLGSEQKPDWKRNSEGLFIEFEPINTSMPITFKIQID